MYFLPPKEKCKLPCTMVKECLELFTALAALNWVSMKNATETQCHQQRMDLIDMCNSDVAQAMDYAHHVETYFASLGTSSPNLSEQLEQTNKKLHEMVAKFPPLDKVYLQTVLNKHGLSEQHTKPPLEPITRKNWWRSNRNRRHDHRRL